jgi:hypothetical protein
MVRSHEGRWERGIFLTLRKPPLYQIDCNCPYFDYVIRFTGKYWQSLYNRTQLTLERGKYSHHSFQTNNKAIKALQKIRRMGYIQ